MLTVVCVKVGTKYSADYVNKLQNMVARHLTIPHDFICITDDHEDVNCKCILPEGETDGWWTKLTIFKKDPYGIKGKILYFDLDVVIRENVDKLATYDSDFIIMKDLLFNSYNSSVFLLESGARHDVWDSYIKDPTEARKYATGGDQHWITMKAKADLWPTEWVKSYKVNNFKEEGKVVVYHGIPKPHQCTDWTIKEWL